MSILWIIIHVEKPTRRTIHKAADSLPLFYVQETTLKIEELLKNNMKNEEKQKYKSKGFLLFM